MRNEKNRELLDRARTVIPGGVNSPVRAFEPVGARPPFIKKGKGAHVWDEDDNEYIDYVGSYGPLILGHSQDEVVARIKEAADRGTSFGAPTAAEVELAELLVERVPGVQMVRLVNSGTEATMTALRLARGFTGREKIVKFAGCYHGHSDSFLVEAGSGAASLGVPNSPGVPASVVEDTLTATFNDLVTIEKLFEDYPDDIAAVIVEPVCGNAGVIPPEHGFLEGLREITCDHDTLLIFDEVMTGFRVGPESAQGLYDVRPDLTTLGKVIGGGLPIGAVGGRTQVMEMLAPTGPVYQAGTLSGNPIAVAAGLATLRQLDDDAYEKLENLASRLERGIRENLERVSVNCHFQRVGAMACLFFSEAPVKNSNHTDACDSELFAVYFREMLKRGIYLPPSQHESFFISTAHTEEDIARTVDASLQALRVCENR